MFNVVGRETRKIYGSSISRNGAERVREKTARRQYVSPSYFEIVGPICKLCGKACPCGKKKAKS
jgi:hypothetical protein